ncbi:spermine synthase [Paenibacillus agricola]|uniref:Spermine synthase n=1 Tax=Paenibacillus agricola TaxID=2716264 RepID=A0ABX0JEQ7_9BACL|nr:spermine synthase [Paenibacillus agricola]NHN33178.1 spermine synthase [Paenibacillus agricola]
MITRETFLKDVIITFFIAFTLIVYEVFLSRFFATIMDYNYVFLVVSLATLGIGIGGYFAYSQITKHPLLRNHHILGWYAVSIAAVIFTMYILTFVGIFFYAGMALIPFFLGGLVLADLMQRHRDHIGLMYFSDLAGGGLGAVSSIFLMDSLNPLQTIGLISLIGFSVFVACYFGEWNLQQKLFWSTTLAILFINFINPFYSFFSFKAYQTSPHNVFLDEKEARVIFTKWNAFSRTDVFDAGDDDLLYITIDGGAVSPISKFNGELTHVDYLRNTTSYLAFQGRMKNRALIIGGGGGQEVLLAKMTGYKIIEAVDINEGSFLAVRDVSQLSNNVFKLPGVEPIVSDGRNYIRETNNKYDLIYLSLVKKNTENGFGLSLMENYIFTQEAIAEYMNKLEEGGSLGFLVHDEVELFKMVYAAKKYFKKRGVQEQDISKYLAVIGTYQHLGHVVTGLNGSKITRPLLIIGKRPFEYPEAVSLLAAAKQIQQIPIHIPYVNDQFMQMNIMMKTVKVNLEANIDDMPFFYNKMVGISPKMIMLLVAVLLVALFMGRASKLSIGTFTYFSAIAIGFMMIEVTLMQKLVLPLGHPTLSFVLVLGVLLVSGGMGSYFSKYWFRSESNRYIPILVIGLLVLGINAAMDGYNAQSLQMDVNQRVIVTALVLVPLGFFMGMPFPYGMSRVKEKHVAASWGVNGILTVVGSLLATILSFTWGFSTAMNAGAAIYILLYVIQPKLKF